MQKALLICFFICLPGGLLKAQANKPGNKIKTDADVIAFAKEHKSRFHYEVTDLPPIISYDEKTNKWKVEVMKTGYSDKGQCKHTNGCTTVRRIVILLDAKSRKSHIVKDTTDIFPNYE
jgi:hypothetical protein